MYFDPCCPSRREATTTGAPASAAISQTSTPCSCPPQPPRRLADLVSHKTSGAFQHTELSSDRVTHWISLA